MSALGFLMLGLICQAVAEIPPSPAPPPPRGVSVRNDSAEQRRAWLLARLILDRQLDAAQAARTGEMLNRMNAAQLQALVAAYEERDSGGSTIPSSPRPDARSPRSDASSSDPALEAARRELAEAERLRDQLRRELMWRQSSQPAWSTMTYQTLAMRQQMELQNLPYTYGGIVMEPFAPWGVLPYGAWGVGAPQFGALYFPW